MSSTYSDRVSGVATHVAIKAPCRVVAPGPIELWGLQTLSGVQLVDGDRVVVPYQPNPIDNGIYVAHDQDWARAIDMDGSRDVVNGTFVLVIDGPIGVGQRLGAIWRLSCTEKTPVIGKHPITFTYTPEDATAAAAIAAAQSAADALAAAQQAVNAANSALLAVHAANTIEQWAFTLSDGVQSYGPLPLKPATAADVAVYVDGLAQEPSSWELGDEHGEQRSIVLVAPVSSLPAAGEIEAGLQLFGTVIGGVTDVVIGNKTITDINLADNIIALDGRIIKPGPANKQLVTNSSGIHVYADFAPSVEWTNVKKYGALGVGTDDTDKINQAIDDMPSPGVLYFPPGNFGVNSLGFTMTKPGMIMGVPNCSSIIALESTGDIITLTQQFTHVEGLLFKSFPGVIRSLGANSTIKITTANQCRIKRCRFSQQATSIWATSVFGATLTLENLEIYDSVPGSTCIIIDSGLDISIIDSIVSNIQTARPENGLLVTACGDVTIINSQFLACDQGLNAFAATGKVIASLEASDSFFDSCGRGASISANGGAIVRSVFINSWFGSASVDHGLCVSTSAGGFIDGLELSSCSFLLNSHNGFVAFDSGVRNVRITGGYAAQNGDAGIALGIDPSSPVSDWSVIGINSGASNGLAGNRYGIFNAGGVNSHNYTCAFNTVRGNSVAGLNGIIATSTATEVNFGNRA